MKKKALSKRLLAKSLFSLIKDETCTVSNLKEFINAGYDINYQETEYYHTALIRAAGNYMESIVLELINQGAETNFVFDNGASFLSFASDRDLLRVVKKLIDNNITPVDKDFITNLHGKCLEWMKKYETQKYLIDKYPEIFSLLKHTAQKHSETVLDIIHPKIKKEYPHLDQSADLNLL